MGRLFPVSSGFPGRWNYAPREAGQMNDRSDELTANALVVSSSRGRFRAALMDCLRVKAVTAA